MGSLLEHARRFGSGEALAAELAQTVAERLTAGIETRGEASLVISGGRTPLPFFKALATIALPWEHIVVTLADERWVTEESPDSNARLVRENLLQGPAAAAQFVGLHNYATTPTAGEIACAEALGRVSRPFDAVVLGMGGDGHTASLFPGSAELERAIGADGGDLVCCAVHGEKPPRERITLTAPTLLDSRWIGLHITGDDKWQVLQRALTPGDVREYPVRVILHQQQVSVHVFWSP